MCLKYGGNITQDYFTSRVAIRNMVRLIKPKPGELVQDPACGVGGFLVEAAKYIYQETDSLFDESTSIQEFQRRNAFTGIEINSAKYPLLVLNCLIYGIESSILSADSLSSVGRDLPKVDVILCNPPYSKFKKGEKATRDDLTYPSQNRHFCFLQHFYRSLKPGGRAAVMLPDNVLFEERSEGRKIRQDLMNKCNLHTILRLPEGLYPGEGTKVNILFFTRGHNDVGNTKHVWLYDMRTGMPSFGKRNPVTDSDFKEFEDCFGDDPCGVADRVDQGADGRFRCFSREEISARGDNLDITWLSSANAEQLEDPEFYTDAILKALETATSEMRELKGILGTQHE